jgi:hypothetical protein
MEIAFIRKHKYICHHCEEQYEWQQDKSIVFGKPEYKTESERKIFEKNFCCPECFYFWKNVT